MDQSDNVRSSAAINFFCAAFIVLVTLVLVSPTAKILLLSFGFLIAFMLDVSATARHLAPLWHKNFRKFMTISVLIALAIAFWAVRTSIADNTSP